MKLKPTDKWLIDVNAFATPEGWRHPKTNELLKSVKLDVNPNEKTFVSREAEPTLERPQYEQLEHKETPIIDVVVVKPETVETETETETKEISDTSTSKKQRIKRAK